MHPTIAYHLPALGNVCRAHDVARLTLFGSAAREHDFEGAKSDADFLVAFKPDSPLPPLKQFFSLADALEKLFDRPIDLVEEGSIKNPYIHAAIEADKVVVYSEAGHET